jgi:hypothetical protein
MSTVVQVKNARAEAKEFVTCYNYSRSLCVLPDQTTVIMPHIKSLGRANVLVPVASRIS